LKLFKKLGFQNIYSYIIKKLKNMDPKDFKPYYYYAKSDSSKEKIDGIVAMDLDLAIEYFAERKQMNKYTFLKIYNVESK